MIRRLAVAMLGSVVMAGCATTSTGYAGVGGITDKVDDFTRQRVIESGKGFVYCLQSEGLLCDPQFLLSFRWTGGADIITTVTFKDYVDIRQLEWSVDGEIIQSIEVGTSTNLDGKVLDTGSRIAVIREATQRFAIPRDMAKRLLSAKSTLVRVRLANSVVSKPGDFLRPTVSGQPAAAEILREILKRADGAA